MLPQCSAFHSLLFETLGLYIDIGWFCDSFEIGFGYIQSVISVDIGYDAHMIYPTFKGQIILFTENRKMMAF